MAREQRTRQSNREYQRRIRQAQYRKETNSSQRQFRVVSQSQTRTPGTVPRSRTQSSHTRVSRKQAGRHRNVRTDTGAKRASIRREQTDVPRRQAQASRQRPLKQAAAEQVSYYDYTLVFIVLFLVMFGLLMLYTASIYKSGGYFMKQCCIALAGVVGMITVSFIDYHVYARKPVLILAVIGSVVLVLLVWSPIGVEINGARRWIGIGDLFTVQPAELFKISVIITNAYLIQLYSRMISAGKLRVLALFVALAALEGVFVLIVTRNLSSGLIISLITICMIFVAFPGYKIFISIFTGLGVLVTGAVYYILRYCDPSDHYRFQRIFAWLAPERLPDQSKVFQTNQALYSIGSGGLWGKGLGAGLQKTTLPEAMNDMIFAIICEELGMIGAFLVMVMFAILLYRLMYIAKNSKDLFGGMLAAGIFSHFMLQVVLNIGVVTNLLPSTGVTLPFISYGGTALVILMVEVGIALNVSRQIDLENPGLMRRKAVSRENGARRSSNR